MLAAEYVWKKELAGIATCVLDVLIRQWLSVSAYDYALNAMANSDKKERKTGDCEEPKSTLRTVEQKLALIRKEWLANLGIDD